MPTATLSGAAGMSLLGEALFQLLRRHTQQHAKPVGRDASRELLRRHLALDLVEQGFGLREVDLGHRAGLEFFIREPDRLLLQLGVLVEQVDLPLQDAELHVVRGDVCDHGHEDVGIVLDGGVELRARGFDRAAEAAPEIEFPGQVEVGRQLAGVAVDRRDARPAAENGPERTAGQRGDAGRAARVAPRRILGLREQIAHRDAMLSPRLQHAETRFAQREVLAIRVADKVVEHGIVEDLPPLGQVIGLLADANVAGIDPLRRHVRRRFGVIGPDFQSIVYVFGERGAPAQ